MRRRKRAKESASRVRRRKRAKESATRAKLPVVPVDVSQEPTTERSLHESTSSEWDFADTRVRQTTVLPIVMCVVLTIRPVCHQS